MLGRFPLHKCVQESGSGQTIWSSAGMISQRDVIPRVPPVEASFPGPPGSGASMFYWQVFVRRNRRDRLLPSCLSLFSGCHVRISRRRAEQRLLQLVEAFRKPRPFAGECMLRAIRSSCARPQVVGRCRCLRFLPRQRRLFSLGSEGGLLQLLLLLFCRELRRSGAAPLTVEMSYILLVDLLLLLRRRVRTRNIEASVLHEIEIGIAATRLAASGKFRVAFGERRGSRFLARRLLGFIRAFL